MPSIFPADGALDAIREKVTHSAEILICHFAIFIYQVDAHILAQRRVSLRRRCWSGFLDNASSLDAPQYSGPARLDSTQKVLPASRRASL